MNQSNEHYSGLFQNEWAYRARPFVVYAIGLFGIFQQQHSPVPFLSGLVLLACAIQIRYWREAAAMGKY